MTSIHENVLLIGSAKTVWTTEVRRTATSYKLVGCQFNFQLQDERDNGLKNVCYIKHYNISGSNHKGITFIAINDKPLY